MSELSPLAMACEAGDIREVKRLVEESNKPKPGTLASAQGSEGPPEPYVNRPSGLLLVSPLHCAAESCHVDVVKFLLAQRGCDANAKDLYQARPLHYAAASGRVDLVETLLNGGVEVSARDAEGNTPQHYAAAKGHLPILQLLVSRSRQNIDDRNHQGWSMLHFAAANCHADMMVYLLKNSARPDVPTTSGATPLHMACNSNNIGGVEILLQHGADRTIKNAAGHVPSQLSANPTIREILGYVGEDAAAPAASPAAPAAPAAPPAARVQPAVVLAPYGTGSEATQRLLEQSGWDKDGTKRPNWTPATGVDGKLWPRLERRSKPAQLAAEMGPVAAEVAVCEQLTADYFNSPRKQAPNTKFLVKYGLGLKPYGLFGQEQRPRPGAGGPRLA